MTSTAPPSTPPERFLIFGPTRLMDGVGRFNNELVRGLVQGGHEVRILTTPPSVEIPGAVNVDLPRPPENLLGLANWEGYAFANAVHTLDEKLRSGEGWTPTTILVHGKYRNLGPHIRDFYPEARLMQVGHNLSYYTEHPIGGGPWAVPGFQRGFSRTLADTDVAIGVGPLLTSDHLRLAPHKPVLEAAPPIATSSRGDVQRRERVEERRRDATRPVRFLLYGRLGDDNKGLETALQAMENLKRKGYGNARLTLLGVPDNDIPSVQTRMDKSLGTGVVECKPYTASDAEVRRERDRADVVLMPSVREHFGLVASEALGEGIPVLTPEGAGSTLFLTDPDRFPTSLTRDFIVHDEDHCRARLEGAAEPETPRSELWAQAMGDMIDNYPQRLDQATVLRDRYLADRYTGRDMADAFVAAAQGLDAYAKQGPGGVLLAADGSRLLPVSVGPTLDTLESPRERQRMHHQALGRAGGAPERRPTSDPTPRDLLGRSRERPRTRLVSQDGPPGPVDMPEAPRTLRGEEEVALRRDEAREWLSKYWEYGRALVDRGRLDARTAPAMLELHAQADRVAAVAYEGRDEQLKKHTWYQKVQKAVFVAGHRGVDNAALPSNPQEYFSATPEERTRYMEAMKAGRAPGGGISAGTARAVRRSPRSPASPGAGQRSPGTQEGLER